MWFEVLQDNKGESFVPAATNRELQYMVILTQKVDNLWKFQQMEKTLYQNGHVEQDKYVDFSCQDKYNHDDKSYN